MTISERFEMIQHIDNLIQVIKRMYLSDKLTDDEFNAVIAHIHRVRKIMKGC